MILRWLKRNRKIGLFISSLLELLCSRNTRTKLYMVGGSVRDLLEGRLQPKDIDLMVTNISYKELGQVLSELYETGKYEIREIISVGKHFPVYKVSVYWFHKPIDVALPRAEGSTGEYRNPKFKTSDVQAKKDSARRDFTINAIFFKFILKEGKIDGKIVDYNHGITALARKEIKAVGRAEDRFAEDPLRMLRAIRQKNERKGFSIEKNTWDAICRSMPHLIHTISPERIAEEFVRSLQVNPVQTYIDWKDSGALQKIIPEFANLTDTNHDHLKKKFEYLSYFGREKESDSVLVLSCLLSELALREVEENFSKGTEKLRLGKESSLQDYREVNFYNLKVPNSIARRLKLPNIKEIKSVLNNFARLIYYEQLRNRRAVVEKILSGNSLASKILILYSSHQKATLQNKVDFDFLMDKFKTIPRLVSGTDFLKLGFLPRSHMSFILESIRDKQLWDEIKTKEDAIEYGRILFQRQIGLKNRDHQEHNHLRRLE